MMQKLFNTIALTTLIISTPVFALESDSKQPIQIEADQGALDQIKQTTTFTGNVIIKQGTINIKANSVAVSRNDKGEQLMKASGNPVYFSQTLDDNKGIVNGQASNVDYASATNIVTLTGNAKVQRGGDLAQGAIITYNTRTEIYTLTGTPLPSKPGVKPTKSGRVNVIIQPSSTKPNSK